MAQKDSTQRPIEDGILILDYGSQYTLLIARRLRELGVYSEVISGTTDSPPSHFNWHGVILSGGPDSATDDQARSIPAWVLESETPILGICYGLQLIAKHFSCEIRSGLGREYGQAKLLMKDSDSFPAWATRLKELPREQTVWMSHGDDIQCSNDQFKVFARTEDHVVAIAAHAEKPILGLQFHPEVQHTECGSQILELFALKICKAQRNWLASDMLESTMNSIRRTMSLDLQDEKGHVLMAVSGGVDSTVSLALMSKALGAERVTGVFINHGLLRKDEAPWVRSQLEKLGVHLVTLDRQKEFLEALEGVSDPESKRKIIGRQFIKEFEEFAKKRAMEGQVFTHLGQGTLYPDVIESAGHGHGSKVIKSHHNVGGLPEKLHLKLIEPFRYLFKDEVRQIGESIGLPHELVHRHPFPGPGLAIRILGKISEDKIQILQKADDIFVKRLKEENLYDKVWQAFAVLLPVKSVGVMGDQRTYEWTCALRAVAAEDGMTAGVGELPLDFLIATGNQIVRQVQGINRVVYDITSKPPATIEWE